MLVRKLILLGLIVSLAIFLKPSSNLSSDISRCESPGCFRDIITSLLDQNSISQSLTKLSTVSSGRCHTMTHFLGQEIYKKYGDLTQAFRQCDGTCLGGCYHGVVEEILKENPSLIVSDLAQVCNQLTGNDNRGLYQDCLHGLGHGVMAFTGGDLTKSLALCDNFAKPDYCYLGVFMENSSSPTNRDHPSRFIKSSDPLYPCDILDKKYLQTCYTEQSNYFYDISGGDWQKTIDLCRQVPSDYRSGCISYVGGNVIFFGQEDQLDAVCNKITEAELNEACYQGAHDAQLSSRRL